MKNNTTDTEQNQPKKDKEEIFGRCLILKPWLDWEYNVHSDEAQIARQGRAMTYPFSFKINKKNQTARFSSTSELPYYDTTLNSCDCFDFQERKLPCKHIYRLAVELNIIDIIKRKGGGYDADKINEIKNSNDIDSDPEQVKRQKSGMEAKCKPAQINYETKTAIFAGSGKEPYTTTIDTCTCRDFFVRRLPCKHIYRLRYELNK